MPRINIYLPDELAAAVKGAELEVSAICQAALREAVAAREQGVTAQIEALQVAVRLRRTTPQGQRALGAADGARWAKEAATVKELDVVDRVVVNQMPGDDEEPSYMVQWDGDAASYSQFELGYNFDTLGSWLQDNSAVAMYGTDGSLALEADEYLAGFVDAAQRVWRELQPLVNQDEAVLRRRIGLLQDIERDLLIHGDAPVPAAAQGSPTSTTAARDAEDAAM